MRAVTFLKAWPPDSSAPHHGITSLKRKLFWDRKHTCECASSWTHSCHGRARAPKEQGCLKPKEAWPQSREQNPNTSTPETLSLFSRTLWTVSFVQLFSEGTAMNQGFSWGVGCKREDYVFQFELYHTPKELPVLRNWSQILTVHLSPSTTSHGWDCSSTCYQHCSQTKWSHSTSFLTDKPSMHVSTTSRGGQHLALRAYKVHKTTWFGPARVTSGGTQNSIHL